MTETGKEDACLWLCTLLDISFLYLSFTLTYDPINATCFVIISGKCTRRLFTRFCVSSVFNDLFFQSLLNNMRYFLFKKPTDALISQIYLCKESLHVSGSSSAHHQEFSTVLSALVYIMQVLMTAFKHYQDGTHLESCLQTCMAYTSAESIVENS